MSPQAGISSLDISVPNCVCCSLRRRQVCLDVVVVTLNERNDGRLTRPPRRLVSLLKTRFERIDVGARQGTDTRQQQTRSPPRSRPLNLAPIFGSIQIL